MCLKSRTATKQLVSKYILQLDCWQEFFPFFFLRFIAALIKILILYQIHISVPQQYL